MADNTDNLASKQQDIHLSIISHGQWTMVKDLLNDLAQLKCHQRFQITLTFNINEPYTLPDYPLLINSIHNSQPKGFGDNHNFAFSQAPDSDARKYFVVLNPDIRIHKDIFTMLTQRLEQATMGHYKKIGVIAPAIVNAQGQLENAARELPTPLRLLKKIIHYRHHKQNYWPYSNNEFYQPDWIAGMFMMFSAHIYQKSGGFNPAYYLYYEDVELCSRLWLNNYCVMVEPKMSVEHNAQRTSHVELKYMRWHIISIMRFFISDVFRSVRRLHANRSVTD